jgi:DNA-binding NtrC family response regulator
MRCGAIAGNRAAAARELGVDASTLFRKLKALGAGIAARETASGGRTAV